MKQLQVTFVYSILVLFTMLALRAWYGFYTEFLSEESIANGLIALLFTVIVVTGWILCKQIIEEVIK